MNIYHIIVKTSYELDWIKRVGEFWTAIKSFGIQTDEKVLYVKDNSQVDAVYSAAVKYKISIILHKVDENE